MLTTFYFNENKLLSNTRNIKICAMYMFVCICLIILESILLIVAEEIIEKHGFKIITLSRKQN